MLYEPTRQWMKDYLRVRLASGAFAAAGFGLSLAVGFSLFTESDINRSLGFEGVIFAILGAACVFLFDLVFRSHAFAAIVVPDGIYSKGQSQSSIIRWEDIIHLYFHKALQYLTVHASDGRIVRVAVTRENFPSLAHDMAEGWERSGVEPPIRCTPGALLLWLATGLIRVSWGIVAVLVGIQGFENLFRILSAMASAAGALTIWLGPALICSGVITWIAREEDGWRLFKWGRSFRLYRATSEKGGLSCWKTDWMGTIDVLLVDGKCQIERLSIAPWLAGAFIAIAIEAEHAAMSTPGSRLPETLEFPAEKPAKRPANDTGIKMLYIACASLIICMLFWGYGIFMTVLGCVFSISMGAYLVAKMRNEAEWTETARGGFCISLTRGIQYPAFPGKWFSHECLRDIVCHPSGAQVDLIGASGQTLISFSGVNEGHVTILQEILNRIPVATTIPIVKPARKLGNFTGEIVAACVCLALVAFFGKHHIPIAYLAGITAVVGVAFVAYLYSRDRGGLQYLRIEDGWVRFFYRNEVASHPLSDFSEVRYGLVSSGRGKYELTLHLVTQEGREITLHPQKQKDYGLFLFLRRELAEYQGRAFLATDEHR